jgi:hypothetical protein
MLGTATGAFYFAFSLAPTIKAGLIWIFLLIGNRFLELGKE